MKTYNEFLNEELIDTYTYAIYGKHGEMCEFTNIDGKLEISTDNDFFKLNDKQFKELKNFLNKI